MPNMKTAWRKESRWSFTPSHARPAATYTLPRTYTPARYAPTHIVPRRDAHGSTRPCITHPGAHVSRRPRSLSAREKIFKNCLQNIFKLILFSTSKQNDKTKINFKNMFTKFLKYVLINST